MTWSLERRGETSPLLYHSPRASPAPCGRLAPRVGAQLAERVRPGPALLFRGGDRRLTGRGGDTGCRGAPRSTAPAARPPTAPPPAPAGPPPHPTTDPSTCPSPSPGR